jgi:hypothetical protein
VFRDFFLFNLDKKDLPNPVNNELSFDEKIVIKPYRCVSNLPKDSDTSVPECNPLCYTFRCWSNPKYPHLCNLMNCYENCKDQEARLPKETEANPKPTSTPTPGETEANPKPTSTSNETNANSKPTLTKEKK